MSDMTLVKVLETQVNESSTTTYDVGEQRERNMRYYSLQPLGNEIPGRSAYISPDVLDAVEGKKAIFSETFLSSREVVKFSNCPYPGEAEQKTAYVNKVFKRNKHAQLFRDGWHDAFVEKRMVVLAEWYRETKDQVVELQGTPAPMVNQQLQQMADQLVGVDDSQVQIQTMPSPQGPMQIVSGKLILELDDSYVKLTLVPQENYYRDPQATYVEDSMWTTVMEEIPRGTLINQGYDPDQIMGLTPEYRFRRDEEDFARKSHDQSWTAKQQTKRVTSQEQVSFYRTFTWLDEEDFDGVETPGFEPEPGFNLYEIHWAHGEILRWAPQEEGAEGAVAIRLADAHQFFEWTEMKIAHAENGMCTADIMAHVQKSNSGLKRLVYDNQQMRNSSRTLALTGALKNPRDLLDNKIGATIWTRDMSAVMPLPAPELSALTMNVIEMFKRDGEERSGLSSLAKGMNSDAVKYQNADDMIARLTNAGTRRVTAAARDFANTFLIPLSQFIVALGKENDKSQSMMEIAGQQVQIIPAQWNDTANEMDVAVALTPDEGAIMTQKLLTINGSLLQDPEMAQLYGLEQKHALYDMVYDFMGVSDTTRLLRSPQDPQFQQEMQQKAQQAQAMEAEAKQKGDAMFGVDLQGKQAQIQALQSKDKLEWSKFSWSQTDDMHDNMLQDEKQAWTQEIQQQEIDLERKQGRNVTVNNG